MKPTTQILIALFLIAILGFFAFQVGLQISASQAIAAAVFLGIIAAVAFFLWKYRGGESSMSRARKFAKNWWRDEMNGEELAIEEEFGMEGIFGMRKMYGFKFKRIHGSQPLVVVVSASKGGSFDIAKYSASPTPDEERDPFKLIDEEYLRSPVELAEPDRRYWKWTGGPKQSGTGVQVNVNEREKEEASAKK